RGGTGRARLAGSRGAASRRGPGGRAAQVAARPRRARGGRRPAAPRAQEEDEEGLTMSVIRGVLSWFRDAFGPGPRSAGGRRSGGSMDIKRDRMVFLGYRQSLPPDGING